MKIDRNFTKTQEWTEKKSDLSERQPNFFIAGAPKCATTAMDAYLGKHPEIFMAEAKETHFFAKDLYPGDLGCSSSRYQSLFEHVSDEKVIGESSVFYMLSKTAAGEIHKARPDAKILFMLRDPVDVMQSHHSQIVFEGLEPETDFTKALELESGRKAQLGNGTSTYRNRVLHYRDIVRFSEQIECFLQYFPKEQLHFVFYDDIQCDLPGTYRSVLKFLGVDPSFQPTFQVKNANKEIRSRRFGNFLRNTPPWFTTISRILLPNEKLRYRARMALKRLNTNYKPRPAIPLDLRRRLESELRPDIERLESLLDRDLSHWYHSARDKE